MQAKLQRALESQLERLGAHGRRAAIALLTQRDREVEISDLGSLSVAIEALAHEPTPPTHNARAALYWEQQAVPKAITPASILSRCLKEGQREVSYIGKVEWACAPGSKAEPPAAAVRSQQATVRCLTDGKPWFGRARMPSIGSAILERRHAEPRVFLTVAHAIPTQDHQHLWIVLLDMLLCSAPARSTRLVYAHKAIERMLVHWRDVSSCVPVTDTPTYEPAHTKRASFWERVKQAI